MNDFEVDGPYQYECGNNGLWFGIGVLAGAFLFALVWPML